MISHNNSNQPNKFTNKETLQVQVHEVTCSAKKTSIKTSTSNILCTADSQAVLTDPQAQYTPLSEGIINDEEVLGYNNPPRNPLIRVTNKP